MLTGQEEEIKESRVRVWKEASIKRTEERDKEMRYGQQLKKDDETIKMMEEHIEELI